MKTYLVTGAAGFIGANYIKYILAKHSDIKVVVLDALTYAGNLGTIAKDIDNERCFFIKGDICSREVVDSLEKRSALPSGIYRRGVRLTRCGRLLHGRNPALSAQPVQRFENQCRHGSHGLSRHL